MADVPASAAQYRPIAVTVEARADGFRWQLLENAQDGSAWELLSAARKSVPRYRDAMAAGLLALQALTEDLDAGPQREEAAEPEKPEEAEDPADDAPEPKKRGGGVRFRQPPLDEKSQRIARSEYFWIAHQRFRGLWY